MLYPVALTNEQKKMIQMSSMLFQALKVVFDKPQGQARGYTNTFLPGGHIEFGESAKDALIREIQEELGIKCTVNNFLGLVEHKWEKNGELHCEVNQVFAVNSHELQNNLKSSESHLKFFWCDGKHLDDRGHHIILRKLYAKEFIKVIDT
ncbi:NUDIX domain-containing protein [Bacillus thuringiensis]|uniref:NUDIX domain-containing protein n=1 Tax=Bacillus thuringiensis TaxID=1428 RepID=UPI001CC17362|nr:NUDIX domain-containing protein [Bacillus thuringiensis]